MADDPKIRDEDRTYAPSTPEANRSIEQGNGVGARDLVAQREPTEAAEHDPFKEKRIDADKENGGADEKRVKDGPGFF